LEQYSIAIYGFAVRVHNGGIIKFIGVGFLSYMVVRAKKITLMQPRKKLLTDSLKKIIFRILALKIIFEILISISKNINFRKKIYRSIINIRKKIYRSITNIRKEGVVFTCYKIYIYYVCNPNAIVTTIKVSIMVYSVVKNLTITFDTEVLSINPEDPGNKRENSEELGGQRKIVRLSGLPDLGLSENAVVNTEL